MIDDTNTILTDWALTSRNHYFIACLFFCTYSGKYIRITLTLIEWHIYCSVILRSVCSPLITENIFFLRHSQNLTGIHCWPNTFSCKQRLDPGKSSSVRFSDPIVIQWQVGRRRGVLPAATLPAGHWSSSCSTFSDKSPSSRFHSHSGASHCALRKHNSSARQLRCFSPNLLHVLPHASGFFVLELFCPITTDISVIFLSDWLRVVHSSVCSAILFMQIIIGQTPNLTRLGNCCPASNLVWFHCNLHSHFQVFWYNQVSIYPEWPDEG